ncbi:hypothetical protein M9H77_28166 [Catharanthus roseus]|uniref:Uncharacterized protein n=1 Tax=Catharanthus roseus TaxID=4058 RepID=A0ACC0AH98_CATRO|nr:hypothetical protein M9H77_28166 [Catharanthus roseus]
MGIKGEEKFQKDYSLCDVYLYTHCKYSEEEISKVLENIKESCSVKIVDTYAPDVYSRETYKRTYQENFHLNGVGNRARDFRRKWIIEIRILPQDVANATCWDIIENIVITSVQAIYKFVFLKVL